MVEGKIVTIGGGKRKAAEEPIINLKKSIPITLNKKNEGATIVSIGQEIGRPPTYEESGRKMIKLAQSFVMKKIREQPAKENYSEKIKLRAERFKQGLTNATSTANATMSKLEEQKKRTERAKRFGHIPTDAAMNLTPALEGTEKAKKQQRALRFGIIDAITEIEKKKQRIERFGIIDAITEIEKKKQRIERFGEVEQSGPQFGGKNKLWGNAIGQVIKNKKGKQ